MLVEIRNHLIDLTLVSCITKIDYGTWSKRKNEYDQFLIILLNQSDPISIESEELYHKDNKQIIRDEFEALHTKLVNFWKIAKNQSNIIKLDS